MLAAVAVGGALGSAARYGVGTVLPHDPGRGLPWATLAVNVTGCLLIGVLMVLTGEVFVAGPLLRPFLGVGVLGGFTTFATYTVEVRALLGRNAPLALGYLVLTVILALAAVTLGVVTARLATRAARTGGGPPR